MPILILDTILKILQHFYILFAAHIINRLMKFKQISFTIHFTVDTFPVFHSSSTTKLLQLFTTVLSTFKLRRIEKPTFF